MASLFSPDEKQVYLNADYEKVMRYDVQPDGTLANGKVFLKGEGSDGIKVDEKGNVYTTNGAGPGEVRITSPDGVRLGTLKLPVLTREPRAQICATMWRSAMPIAKDSTSQLASTCTACRCG